MRSVVIDASVAMKWVVEEPGSNEARELLGGSTSAPDLLFAECGNTLWRAARNGRITPAGLRGALDFFAGLRIEIHPSRSLLHRALDIAGKLDHAAYDCFYLALAEREAIPCVTADRRFADKVRGSEWEAMIDLMHFP